MIYIKMRSLCPLKENIPVAFSGLIQFHRYVAEVRYQFLAIFFKKAVDLFIIHRRAVVLFGEQEILLRDSLLQFFAKKIVVQEIAGLNTDSADLVHITRTDAATGGADFLVGGKRGLLGLIDAGMIGHDEVGSFADHQAVRRNHHPLFLQFLDFADKNTRIDNHAVTYHAFFPFIQNA
ncbi:MAG: hypothetical protein ACD_75C00602G0001 [uncultured bacterium]|nr:MAG: hypothetical protein ACD_75C00602G0001 [uncultured bacterium]